MKRERDPPVSWVIGRGGLLGRNTARALGASTDVWKYGSAFSWEDGQIDAEFSTAIGAFADRVGPRPWRIAWCAGAGIVASAESALTLETRILQSLLTKLGKMIESRRMGPGMLFFASSAGGLYAGSSGPPFDERTDPRPLSHYGHAKLSQEHLVQAWSTEVGVRLLIGRIANLFGPGQNLGKPQGLISQLCWSQLLLRPLSVYVPLGTLRDYLYAPDCGAMIASGLEVLGGEGDNVPMAVVKVMASQRPMTIGAILGDFKRVTKQNPRVSLRASPLGRHQVHDLRLASHTLPQVDRCASTPFAVGLSATLQDLRCRYARAGTRIQWR